MDFNHLPCQTKSTYPKRGEQPLLLFISSCCMCGVFMFTEAYYAVLYNVSYINCNDVMIT